MSTDLVKSQTNPNVNLSSEIYPTCGILNVSLENSPPSNVLQLPSEKNELWINEQQELYGRTTIKPDGYCCRVPPTHTLHSKRTGSSFHCSTPGNEGCQIGESTDDLETNEEYGFKLRREHSQGKECTHDSECCCCPSDLRSSSGDNQSKPETPCTGTEPVEERNYAELSEISDGGDLDAVCGICSNSSSTRGQGRSTLRPSGRESPPNGTHIDYPKPFDGPRRSESFSPERNRLCSSEVNSSRPPRAQTQDCLKKTAVAGPADNGCGEIWPALIPFRFRSHSSVTSQLTMDTISVFKYRIHYPNLMQWSYQLIRSYNRWQSDGVRPVISSHPALVDQSVFVNEVIKKRTQRIKQVPNETRTNFRESKTQSIDGTSPSHMLRSQLWKRRYYALLNAVDFVYKDYQLLHYISGECLFDYVSTPPVLPSNALRPRGNYSSSVWPTNIQDIQNLATVGADPAGHLSERTTQVLLRQTHKENSKALFNWPCLFQISVAFLSDVMAQGRILRYDLDRRLAVYDRLTYVLRQAREQRAKLHLHMSRQRELLDSLTSNLCTIQNRIPIHSPLVLDRPASIRDGLVSDVTSPFVECENLESERPMNSRDARNRSSAKDDRTKSTVKEWAKSDYIQYRTELCEKISNLERVFREEETRRKRLHNRIQELTGNIRVFCRLRPDNEVSNVRRNAETEVMTDRGRYLRVSSKDKLIFCSDTLKDQLQERRSCIPFAYQGARTLSSASGAYGSSMNPLCPGIGNGSAYATSTGAPKCFIFDRVFGPRATQAEVYQEVDDLIVSCIDGYNVCIMAYGQTGSGKTYTMMGTEEEPGVNRRAVHSLFERCSRRKHLKYSIFVSIVEIYQENVFDLLEDVDESGARVDEAQMPQFGENTGRVGRKSGRNSASGRWKQSSSRFSMPWNAWTSRTPSAYSSALGYFTGKSLRRRGSVRILSDQLDGVVLQNLHERPVQDETEMLYYLHLAEKQRRVGSTRLNICSSRSHLIILLRVVGEHQFQMTTSRGTLTLADLAGSENVTKSGSTGERFLEAACINKSLSSLGRVFDALRRQQKPTYRETKLTYLLRPTLSGESKCLLFIALRTEPEHAEETWRAIQFGQGAIQVVPGGGNGGAVSISGPTSAALEQDASEGKTPGSGSGSVPSCPPTPIGGLSSPAILLRSIRGSVYRTKFRGRAQTCARNPSSSNITGYLQ